MLKVGGEGFAEASGQEPVAGGRSGFRRNRDARGGSSGREGSLQVEQSTAT